MWLLAQKPYSGRSENILLKFISLFALLFFAQCISKKRGIVYDRANQLALDIYGPKTSELKNPVLIFVHGGNWRSGSRARYKFFGKGFAKKGVVAVVIDYRLNNRADYNSITLDIAKAVKWVKDSIAAFGGDPSKIFISGHSSGGHNAALVATDSAYFDDLAIQNPLKGIVLIDAFGLDIYSYLKNSMNPEDSIYFPTFTKNPDNWKKASPVYHLSKTSPKFLLFTGGKTFQAIKKDNETFMGALKVFQPGAKAMLVPGKKHIAMIAQFFNPRTKRYKEILEFMKERP